MSLATKIAAGLCICPVVAAPPALMHKPTRDKIARAAGYVPKPAAAPIAIAPEVACVEPTPSTPAVGMSDIARRGPLALTGLPLTPGNGFPPPIITPGRPFVPGQPDVPSPPEDGVIPGIPEPATWTIMVVGFGMVGAAIRRNTRTTSNARTRKAGA